MDFRLSDEQVALRKVAGDVFAECARSTAARQAIDAGENCVEVFGALVELDLLGLLCPESVGGSDATVLDAAVVAEEAGRRLVADPIVNTVGRAAVLLRRFVEFSPVANDLLTQMVKGTARISVLDGPGVVLDQQTATSTAAPALQAASATTFLLAATSVDGTFHVVLVEAGPGVVLQQRRPLDPTRGLAEVRLEAAPAVVIASGDPARGAWDAALDVARVLLAGQSLGTTSQARALAVEYALQRQAFGRAIGSYQAVKHKIVDLYVLEEQLRSLVWLAAWSIDAEPENAPLYVRAAAAYAADAVVAAARTLVHVHGGIGFTWEHDAHLFWRRAMTDRLLLGSADEHREAVVTYLLESKTVVP
jgi:alkylation response protein AidB-like acyl-CoA dehydrogenase